MAQNRGMSANLPLEAHVIPATAYVMRWDGSVAGGKEIQAILDTILPLRDTQLDAIHVRQQLRTQPELDIRTHSTRNGRTMRLVKEGAGYIAALLDGKRVIGLADLGESIELPVETIIVHSRFADRELEA